MSEPELKTEETPTGVSDAAAGQQPAPAGEPRADAAPPPSEEGGQSARPTAYVNELSRHVGAEVTLRGWLYNRLSSGKLLFPQFRDGTGVVQCVVFKKNVPAETWDALRHLGQESSLIIRGSVRAD